MVLAVDVPEVTMLEGITTSILIRMEDLIVGIGEALWDIYPHRVKKLGGAPANFAYHVAQLGLNGCVLSAVGNDSLGDEIIEKFDERDLKQFVQRVNYPTGQVIITLNDAGIPSYDIKENAAWDNIPFTDKLDKIAVYTKAVCFGSLAQRSITSRKTINRFIDVVSASNKNALIIFDINLRQTFYTKEILVESFKKCNVLKINDEEIVEVCRLFYFPGRCMQESCRILMEKYNLEMVILTCGAQGSYIFTGSEVSFEETPQVEVVDTVGAGDSFTAAFCVARLRDKSVKESHKFAVDISAYVCTQSGAMPVLPQALRDRLK